MNCNKAGIKIISIKMEVDFHLLVKRIKLYDKSALQKLKDVSGIIIRQWAEKDKQELRWMASSGKSVDYMHLIKDVIIQYVEMQHDSAEDIIKFEQFKNYLIRKFEENMRSFFSEFIYLLKYNDQKAWKIVFYDLEKRAAGWFYMRNMMLNKDSYPVFCDSVEVLYSNFMKKELTFPDSFSFKSYFFKTLENKYYESLKDPYLKKSVPLDSRSFHLFTGNEGELRVEHYERQKVLINAFGKLNHEEQAVLRGYFFEEKKLRDIAEETGQTEENIRIKKHRALKKLFNHFKLIRYES